MRRCGKLCSFPTSSRTGESIQELDNQFDGNGSTAREEDATKSYEEAKEKVQQAVHNYILTVEAAKQAVWEHARAEELASLAGKRTDQAQQGCQEWQKEYAVPGRVSPSSSNYVHTVGESDKWDCQEHCNGVRQKEWERWRREWAGVLEHRTEWVVAKLDEDESRLCQVGGSDESAARAAQIGMLRVWWGVQCRRLSDMMCTVKDANATQEINALMADSI